MLSYELSVCCLKSLQEPLDFTLSSPLAAICPGLNNSRNRDVGSSHIAAAREAEARRQAIMREDVSRVDVPVFLSCSCFQRLRDSFSESGSGGLDKSVYRYKYHKAWESDAYPPPAGEVGLVLLNKVRDTVF